jgi:hypothetical protein
MASFLSLAETVLRKADEVLPPGAAHRWWVSLNSMM